MSEDPEYGFAVGRVRSLEAGLLDRARYERLVHAKDGGDFANALGEAGYARFFEGDPDVPRALALAAAEYFTFFSQYVPDRDRWLLNLFLLPAQFRSLKVALKWALALPAEERAAALAGLPAVLLGPDPEPAKRAAREIVERFEQHGDPADVDLTLDRLAQEFLLKLAAPSEFLSGLYRLHADVENLRTFMRVRATPDDGSASVEFRRAFLPGGTVGEQVMTGLLAEPCDTAVERLTRPAPFGCGSEIFFDYLEQGSCQGTEKRSIVRMERLGRELELQYLRQTRYATFGHEPLVTFYLLQENELRNLRQLYAAKVAGLPAEIVQELVAYAD